MKNKPSRGKPEAPPSSFLLAAVLVKEATVRLDEGLANNGPVQLHSAARFLRLTLASCEEELRVLDTVAPLLRLATTPLEEAVLRPYYAAAFGSSPPGGRAQQGGARRATRKGRTDVLHSRVEAVGMTFTVTCDICGQPQSIVVPWHELVLIANRQVPAGWIYLPRAEALRPELRCYQCGNEDILLLGPAEARLHVRAGVQAGYVRLAVDRRRPSRKRTKARKRSRQKEKR